MGRANSQYLQEDQGSQRAEWGELRSELVALLDQVEDQVARAGSPLEGLTERMRDLRHQMAEPEREAPRATRRMAERNPDYDDAPPPARNPRDSLENAIQQIRARQLAREAEPRRTAPPVETGPRFDEMARSVAGMTDRLGRLEAELRNQSRGHTANVKEIADQVAQLSQVVELLAGAVGETGQVKRLEGQIAALAKLISDERHADTNALATRLDEVATTVAALAHLQTDQRRDTSLTDRLDDLSATVARLADMQPDLAQRADTSGLAQRLEDVTMTVGRLADLQVQFAERANTATLASRIDDVNGTISRLTEILADPSGKAEIAAQTSAVNQRLDDMTASVARIADIQTRLAERSDTTSLGRKIDEVGATVGKLADLQIQVAQIVDNPRDGVREGLGAIEAGIRNIYDRLDTLERAVPAAQLDGISDQLTRIAAAIKQPQAQPQGLIELIDALNTRIGDVEARNGALDGLTHDVDALREVVAGALEPRFAALEERLTALSGRPAEINTTQLEAQVRQLVARMDQTGEQLSGLAQMYATPAPAPEPVEPDYAQLAAEIATRTRELQRDEPAPDFTPDFAELERRIAQMIEAQVMPAAADTDPEERAALKATMDEVNDRLKRLEAAIAARADAAPLPVTTLIPATPPVREAMPVSEPEQPQEPADEPEAAPLAEAVRAAFPLAPERRVEADPIAPLLRSLADEDAFRSADLKSVGPQNRDSMPNHPGADAPLMDRPFDAPPPADAPRGPRPRHPGLADMQRTEMPTFDPTRIERPAPPRSTLLEGLPPNAGLADAAPEPVIAAETAAPTTVADEDLSDPIARIRRTARASAAKKPTSIGGNSLIGRAFARLQADEEKRGAPAPDGVTPEPQAVKSRAAQKASAALKADTVSEPARPFAGLLPRRKLAGDKPVPEGRGKPKARAEAVPEAASVPLAETPGATAAEAAPADAPVPESFLLRHRRPILLGAALVAIVLLTINLINQQLAAPVETATAPPAAPEVQSAPETGGDKLSDATLDPVPMAQQKNVPVTQPRIIPMVDDTETGAIGATQNAFANPDTLPAGSPAASAAAGLAGADGLSDQVMPLAATLPGPGKLDLPPDALGPADLRQAAANGDARAQFEVAAIYTEGRAVPEDLAQAAVWYERAASQGFAPAQYRLGSMYERGQGVTKDLQQARLWYQQAAEAGNRMAMHNLAALYASGGLGTQQFDAAAKWFEEAANRGLKDSQFNLGMLYARGLGVKQDLAQSYKWFGIAGRHGDKDAAKAQSDIAASLAPDAVRRLDADIAAWQPAPIDLAANFAPIGTWSPSFNPGATISTADVVKNVQNALVALGFDVGTPDGVAGKKTEIAIRAFERATGMSESGTINPRLLAVLGSQPV